MQYRITLKVGYVLTDSQGCIIEDHSAGRAYKRSPTEDWRILGISKRHHSREIIPLAAAASGADIGQGWVHDMDHGTHRMWAMPPNRRAIRVTAE